MTRHWAAKAHAPRVKGRKPSLWGKDDHIDILAAVGDNSSMARMRVQFAAYGVTDAIWASALARRPMIVFIKMPSEEYQLAWFPVRTIAAFARTIDEPTCLRKHTPGSGEDLLGLESLSIMKLQEVVAYEVCPKDGRYSRSSVESVRTGTTCGDRGKHRDQEGKTRLSRGVSDNWEDPNTSDISSAYLTEIDQRPMGAWLFLVLLELSRRRHGRGGLGEFEVKDDDETGPGRFTHKDNLAAQKAERDAKGARRDVIQRYWSKLPLSRDTKYRFGGWRQSELVSHGESSMSLQKDREREGRGGVIGYGEEDEDAVSGRSCRARERKVENWSDSRPLSSPSFLDRVVPVLCCTIRVVACKSCFIDASPAPPCMLARNQYLVRILCTDVDAEMLVVVLPPSLQTEESVESCCLRSGAVRVVSAYSVLGRLWFAAAAGDFGAETTDLGRGGPIWVLAGSPDCHASEKKVILRPHASVVPLQECQGHGGEGCGAHSTKVERTFDQVQARGLSPLNVRPRCRVLGVLYPSVSDGIRGCGWEFGENLLRTYNVLVVCIRTLLVISNVLVCIHGAAVGVCFFTCFRFIITGAKKKKQYCHRLTSSVISASPEFKSVYCVGRTRKGGFSAPRDRSAVVTGENCVAGTPAKDVKGPQKTQTGLGARKVCGRRTGGLRKVDRLYSGFGEAIGHGDWDVVVGQWRGGTGVREYVSERIRQNGEKSKELIP
ncbi:hypothetical protein CCUS01_02225 [Colletotrichum cuscutae]|uniref:Uncharacterized protein n=1 Tax=Colletotrichum cuscutae TaxID=1209917 RepID=A0AAI9U329_9PEZI|nr:hypothetical protein CCUS01_02225 [Colletotrichum cuscutae]